MRRRAPLPGIATTRPRRNQEQHAWRTSSRSSSASRPTRRPPTANKAYKSELKTYIRHTNEAIASGDKDKAVAALSLASKKLDKAVSKGVIHKNQAANRKSAIAKKVSAL